MASPDDQSQQQPPDHDAQMVAAVLAVLAVGAPLTATAAKLSQITGEPVAAATKALLVIEYKGMAMGAATFAAGMYDPISKLPPSAIWRTRRANAMFRAAFIWNAIKRLASGQSSVDTERQRWQAHKRAQAKRTATAVTVNRAQKQYGPLLGWYAVGDTKTSAECLAADGRNFTISDPPVIGYPGAVHPHCRCSPGPPHPGGKMVNDSLTVRRSDDASGFFN